MNDEVKSAVRVLEILELLARARKPVSLKDVAYELGYPKSSALGLMRTLVGRGYASRTEDDLYVLNEACRNGPGWINGPEAGLVAHAGPIISRLRNRVGETIMLGVLNHECRLRTVVKCTGTRELNYDTPFSGGLPSYCSAMGRVLLAGRERREVDHYLAHERLVKYTRFTVVDRLTIRRRIDQAAHEGFAISDQEMDLGSTGIAAPVCDAAGRVIAALDIAAISSRYLERREEMIDEVSEHAAQLSALMREDG
ncbi:IclR family transcriptional regulator [Ancylobacter mangrovi]|uniref:IclR family transcriptional regulator n=1 Tax=Ancylobacter mangrovi TaxID=2972472 RepID=UPI002161B7F3|nr:IclR family transcriptional regulator [Ancylobacter mangrovi]MCS0502165.1 IclR family transcriptional regulator [Ancylobacter mangrovi]